ncbi:hypothetical protein ACIBCN_23995 [Nocardia sp. NPDC051052]|uniref:hypothetical protein n=1 Tax=Nocardia sp. NPDC051052 TaxID=3364322 RepID=UPI0037B843BF
MIDPFSQRRRNQRDGRSRRLLRMAASGLITGAAVAGLLEIGCHLWQLIQR